jgi:hypothetical protein
MFTHLTAAMCGLSFDGVDRERDYLFGLDVSDTPAL